MSGFNRITQAQPARSSSTVTPLGVRTNNSNTLNQHRNGYQHVGTPMKRPLPVDASTPAKRTQVTNSYQAAIARPSMSTPPNRMPPPSLQNAPIKKRSVEVAQNRPQDGSLTDGVIINESGFYDDNSQGEVIRNLEEEIEPVEDYDAFPANQQGLYDTGYDAVPDDANKENDGRVAFERVKEETVEMGGFILPGAEKKQIHKSYNWIAGRTDGQYRVVLGYNTLFKPKSKNGIDVTTGEKDSSRWRVVRFENRYKENYPYTEFPAKYLGPIIQALEKARETHEQELKEESVLQ
jgi:hypothetical protein